MNRVANKQQGNPTDGATKDVGLFVGKSQLLLHREPLGSERLVDIKDLQDERTPKLVRLIIKSRTETRAHVDVVHLERRLRKRTLDRFNGSNSWRRRTK